MLRAVRGDQDEGQYLIRSRLSTDGTNSLLINKPVLTEIFELDLGTDNSSTLAMIKLTKCSTKS